MSSALRRLVRLLVAALCGTILILPTASKAESRIIPQFLAANRAVAPLTAYDLSTNTLKDISCIRIRGGTSPISNWDSPSIQSFVTSVSQDLHSSSSSTSSEAFDANRLSVAVAGNYGSARGSFAREISSSHLVSSYATWAKANALLPREELTIKEADIQYEWNTNAMGFLSPAGAPTDMALFRSACGDGFIIGALRGGEISFFASFATRSSTERTDAQSYLNAALTMVTGSGSASASELRTTYLAIQSSDRLVDITMRGPDGKFVKLDPVGAYDSLTALRKNVAESVLGKLPIIGYRYVPYSSFSGLAKATQQNAAPPEAKDLMRLWTSYMKRNADLKFVLGHLSAYVSDPDPQKPSPMVGTWHRLDKIKSEIDANSQVIDDIETQLRTCLDDVFSVKKSAPTPPSCRVRVGQYPESLPAVSYPPSVIYPDVSTQHAASQVVVAHKGSNRVVALTGQSYANCQVGTSQPQGPSSSLYGFVLLRIGLESKGGPVFNYGGRPFRVPRGYSLSFAVASSGVSQCTTGLSERDRLALRLEEPLYDDEVPPYEGVADLE